MGETVLPSTQTVRESEKRAAATSPPPKRSRCPDPTQGQRLAELADPEPSYYPKGYARVGGRQTPTITLAADLNPKADWNS